VSNNEAWIDALYRERASLLGLIAASYPSHIQWTTGEPGFASLYIQLPTGQTTWYIADDDVDLLQHVRTDVLESWDGHDVGVREQRVAIATRLKASEKA
jgi:hypothetical protein